MSDGGSNNIWRVSGGNDDCTATDVWTTTAWTYPHCWRCKTQQKWCEIMTFVAVCYFHYCVTTILSADSSVFDVLFWNCRFSFFPLISRCFLVAIRGPIRCKSRKYFHQPIQKSEAFMQMLVFITLNSAKIPMYYRPWRWQFFTCDLAGEKVLHQSENWLDQHLCYSFCFNWYSLWGAAQCTEFVYIPSKCMSWLWYLIYIQIRKSKFKRE